MKRTFVSLFSGAGGLDQGFISTGWKPLLMVDNWKPAVNTLRKNHPDVLVFDDDLSFPPPSLSWAVSDDVDCIIGGPPCQAFSRLNQNQLFENGLETERNLNDPRRSLFMSFLRLAFAFDPKFIVMENVFDLRNRKLGGTGEDKDRLIIDVIFEEFKNIGYNVACKVLRSHDYNVPQMRKRLIFIGIKKDIKINPYFPDKIPLTTSVLDQFSKIRPDHPNQKRKHHSEEWIEKASYIPQGGYYNDLPPEYKVLKPVSREESSFGVLPNHIHMIPGYCLKTKDGIFLEHMDIPTKWAEEAKFYKIMPRMGTYLRRIRTDISHTITRNPLIHPTENRELTVREKASIQTFPPEYEFVGTTQEQHILVGNAVPCNLGKALAEHVDSLLNELEE